ncbi:DUF4393 domain-containing protein [Ruminococcus sp. OA3]|uniref:DUF4393 domain-containing protein n=2 Tax=Ruminococcus sp. OA3 TaxID=2914164 RepID=UPI001F050A0D|nr:DUF4393 domain-containing protein [Ruminococcus sp. OA3]MCH1984579.1 DUF4393 domain-containing protein [Ruminococcus sp. OA3]
MKVLPDCVDNAIKNVTDEPTRNVGSTLADCWLLVFGGISKAARKREIKYTHDLEIYENELTNSISKIPIERQIEPTIQVTAQALENSKFCVSEKELRELFVNLISSSMDSAYNPSVHPCFAEIIKQMSPLDAKILKEFPLKDVVAIVDYIKEDTRSRSFSVALENVFISSFKDYDIFQTSASISSLIRLGIIDATKTDKIPDKDFYDPFTQTDFFKEFSQETKRHSPFEIAKTRNYCAKLTPLGQNFFRACVAPKY